MNSQNSKVEKNTHAKQCKWEDFVCKLVFMG